MSDAQAGSSAHQELDAIKEKLLEWTQVPKLSFSSDHTLSTSTRPPSLYVYHVPEDLKARRILFGDFHQGSDEDPKSLDAGSQFFQQLFDREELLALLRHDGNFSNYLQNRWNDTLRFDVAQIAAIDEEGVCDAEKRVAKVVFDLAALTLLDLSTDQIRHIGKWALLVTRPSRETDVKADLLLGLQEKTMITGFDVQNTSKHDPIMPLVQDLDFDYMKHLVSIECKNLLLGNPMAYLTLLLLTRLLNDDAIPMLWPKPDCQNCAKFAESHRVQDGASLVIIPSDSLDPSGLDALEIDDLDEEIQRVLQLLPQDSAPDHDETARRNPTGGPFYNEVYGPMKDLLRKTELENLRLETVMKWVTPIRNIVLQGFSQMIRHDLTFGIVSSHNTSFLMQRLREPFGTLIISPLHQPTMENYIVQRVMWFVAAWRDAIERKSLNSQRWTDPYKGVKYSSNDPAPEPIDHGSDDSIRDPDYHPGRQSHVQQDTEDNDAEPRRSKRKTGRKQTQRPGWNDGGHPRHPPPDGGNGRGGGSGGAGSAGGAGNSHSGAHGESSHNKRYANAEDSSSRSGAKRGRHHADINVQADEIHLAFNCIQPLLQSSAFSHYFRVTNLSKGTTDFPIPYDRSKSFITPPRRILAAAIASRNEGDPDLPIVDTSQRRSSVASTASGTSTLSSNAADSSFWSSPKSATSSAYTAPPSSTPSSPSGAQKGVAPGITMAHPNIAAISTPADPQMHVDLSVVVRHGGTILDTKISQSAIGIVWGGNMILEGLSFAVDPIRVVVKLADWDSEMEASISEHGKAILEEAKIYEYLAEIAPKSDIIPHYYGVFNGAGSIALVLSDEGERLPRGAFEALDDDKKRKLFAMTQKLHELGIEHRDISPRNILMDQDENLRIIDFHISKLGHKCPGPIACGELKQLAEDLKLVER
ncbi:hypothetical protein DFH05DRAFT_1559922 [Lentinula detonsa]|uniref:Protein kinase domain-containing protein n=1 Tax=Lentinula detonsa TaxID=2804962 RepID=A0A9W8NSR9_9AGAR|nr:hypothetical protein DFH05DRAFT_1559922 [Lentinula detonsa]